MTASTVNKEPIFVVSFLDQESSSKQIQRPSESRKPEVKKSEPWKRNQYLAALAANFGAVQFGALFGWTAAALPYLRTDDRHLVTSSLQESWITSLMLLGALCAGAPSGYCNQRFGRRATMLFMTPLALGAWALTYFAQHVVMLYVARFLLGIVGGSFTVVAPAYTAETADPDIRGKLSVGFEMGMAIGTLYVEVIGAYVDWQWQTLASAAIVVVGHLLLMVVSESPRYLISKGRSDEAVKSLMWLKNTKDIGLVQKEIDQLELATAENNVKRDSGNQFTALIQPHVLKPLLISMFLHLTCSMTGITPISSYTVDIFRSAGTNIDEFLSTVIFATLGLLATIGSSLVVDTFGRRPLLIISQLLMAVSLGAMGGFYFLKEQNGGISPPSLAWLPMTALGVYIFAFSCGTGPLSFTIQGEILPPEAKGVGTSIITTVKWLASFSTTRFFIEILESFGEACGYWLFASLCFVGLVYVILFVPETKGKTLEQIQGQYIKKKLTEH